MLKSKLRAISLLFFTLGFVVAVTAFNLVYTARRFNTTKKLKIMKFPMELPLNSKYEESLAAKSLDEVKVLCLIMTQPENHKTKAIHVKNTWGRRCNKLLFITTQSDPQLETIVVNVTENTRMALRNKTRDSFLHVHDTYVNEFDWFMKADDDNYVLMENLRYMLLQYHSKTSLFFGFRLVFEGKIEEGYMAGGGYILSKKALIKMAKAAREQPRNFFYPNGQAEDVEMSRTLAHNAIFVDSRDEKLQNRFFPVEVYEFMRKPNFDYWLHRAIYYNVSWHALDCCSDVPIAFHYIKPKEMYQFEYFFYRVSPFGIDKNSSETLPKKIPLNEIIKASDAKSFSPRFIQHEDFHNLESSEMF